ncbi:MAG: hypothetical protein P4L66_14215 [Acetobacteraceae bacterium]|nr:hypothetical protein [Acetobacteraceae bacterium]
MLQSHSPNIAFVSHSDQGGRPDGVQVMLHAGHLYIGHMFSDGITVVDVRNPRAPAPVNFIACPANTRSHHLQVADGLMLVTNSANIWAMQQYQSQDQYFTQSLADSFTKRQRNFTAGLRIFDLATPAAPREIGFCPVEGIGLHRIWWTGGRYAYASCHFDGYSDHILAIFDVADPTQPTLAGTWHLPGMHRAGHEETQAMPGKRWALHHMIQAGQYGYAAWRDGGFSVHDLSDPVAPKLVAHRLLSPPFAGGSHTPLPLPGRGLCLLADEATSNACANGLAHTWIFDVHAPDNPVPFATLPQPGERDYCAVGGKFGPHNLHENRPGTFQSETLIFATWHNAGVRAFDISNPFQPRDVAHAVPAAPTKLVDIRAGAVAVTQSCDVLVDCDGLLYVTDTNAGLSILRYTG